MTQCPICKEPVHVKTQLKCTHLFCLLCIKLHLTKSNFCPLCYDNPLHISDLQVLEENCTSKFTKTNIEKQIKLKNGKFVFDTNTRKKLKTEPNTVSNYAANKKSVNSASQLNLVYNKLNEDKLKLICKQFSLNSGTKRTMIDRIRKLKVYADVENRMSNPLSVYGLARIVNKEHRKSVSECERIVFDNREIIDMWVRSVFNVENDDEQVA